jgi:hypothetical protein
MQNTILLNDVYSGGVNFSTPFNLKQAFACATSSTYGYLQIRFGKPNICKK